MLLSADAYAMQLCKQGLVEVGRLDGRYQGPCHDRIRQALHLWAILRQPQLFGPLRQHPKASPMCRSIADPSVMIEPSGSINAGSCWRGFILRKPSVRFSLVLRLTGTKSYSMPASARAASIAMDPVLPPAVELILHSQSRTTLPQEPCFIRAKPVAKSAAFMRWVITFRTSRPDCSMAIILYQVSNISRP
jgi:hypothetical protein